MPEQPLRILVIGAHPDDADIMAGGTSALWRQLGHTVKLISVTNGEAGHHLKHGPQLVDIRRQEAAAAGRVIGSEYEVLDFRDGRLAPTYEARCVIIGKIRQFQPDLILTHRPNDYHPDHRYTSQLVCDAAYMVTVPAVAPEFPFLRKNPAIAYTCDNFQRPYPFEAQVIVDIEPVLDQVIEMMNCHHSQFYEWLAFNLGYEDQLPADEMSRKAWLKSWYQQRIGWIADRYRELAVAYYGTERGSHVRYADAFEPCEYGAPWTPETIRRLFPFFPSS